MKQKKPKFLLPMEQSSLETVLTPNPHHRPPLAFYFLLFSIQPKKFNSNNQESKFCHQISHAKES